MPRIFDNIDRQLLPELRDTMAVSTRADFCVGYFNLRGWKAIADLVERWSGGDGGACWLLVGMQKNPDEELREALRVDRADGLDTQNVIRQRRQLAQQFREQLTFGPSTNADEVVLQQLARQLRERKVVVKLFLFDYQKAAVKIAAHHLNKRGGVLIGDVVGLGKTRGAGSGAPRRRRLTISHEDWEHGDPQIICPLGLRSDE